MAVLCIFAHLDVVGGEVIELALVCKLDAKVACEHNVWPLSLVENKKI